MVFDLQKMEKVESLVDIYVCMDAFVFVEVIS